MRYDLGKKKLDDELLYEPLDEPLDKLFDWIIDNVDKILDLAGEDRSDPFDLSIDTYVEIEVEV